MILEGLITRVGGEDKETLREQGQGVPSPAQAVFTPGENPLGSFWVGCLGLEFRENFVLYLLFLAMIEQQV